MSDKPDTYTMNSNGLMASVLLSLLTELSMQVGNYLYKRTATWVSRSRVDTQLQSLHHRHPARVSSLSAVAGSNGHLYSQKIQNNIQKHTARRQADDT